MRFIFIILILLVGYIPVKAQTVWGKKRLFNLGISLGVGGVNNFLNPSADLSIKGTMIRGVYGPFVHGGGISQQLFRLSPSARAYWNISVNYLYSQLNGFYDRQQVQNSGLQVDQYRNLNALTGVKVYFGRHWYSFLQAGTSHIQYFTYQGLPDRHSSYNLYFEFCIGFNFASSYHKSSQSSVPQKDVDDDE